MTRAELRRWARMMIEAYGTIDDSFAVDVVIAAREVLTLTAPLGRHEVEVALDDIAEQVHVTSFADGYRAGVARKGRR